VAPGVPPGDNMPKEQLMVDKDRIEGSGKQVKGSVKEKAGEVLGDEDEE